MRILKLLSAVSIVAFAAACTSAAAPTSNPTSSPTVTQPPAPTASPTAAPSPTEDPAPTATPAPTITPAPTVVLSQPHDGMPGITITLAASGWMIDHEGHPARGSDVGDVPEATMLLWSFVPGTEFYVWGDPCRWESTQPDRPATTPDEFAAALAAQASRDAWEPVDVTIGGYTGKSVTLHVPDDAVFDDCEDGSFATYGTDEDPGARTQQGPGQIDEFWIVDVNGSILVIDAMYRQDTSPEYVEEMRAIAESATFDMP